MQRTVCLNGQSGFAEEMFYGYREKFYVNTPSFCFYRLFSRTQAWGTRTLASDKRKHPPKESFQNQGRFPALPSKPVPSVSYPKVRRRTASSKSPLYESETGTLCPSAKTTRPFSTADTWFMLTI